MMSSKAKAARVVATLEFRNHYVEVESDCKRDKEGKYVPKEKFSSKEKVRRKQGF